MPFPNKPAMPPPGAPKPKAVLAIGISPKDGKPEMGSGAKDGELEKAGVVRAADHCSACENYQPDTGECSKLPGQFDPEDACLRFFEKMGDGELDGDEDDMMPPPSVQEETVPAG